MASMVPASIEQVTTDPEREQALADLEEKLLSMENLDRSSPELWPADKSPGVTEFVNNFTITPQQPTSTTKLPYTRDLNQDDQNYLHELAALQTNSLINKVKELHDIAYKLGVDESKEVARGQYLNLFSKNKRSS